MVINIYYRLLFRIMLLFLKKKGIRLDKKDFIQLHQRITEAQWVLCLSTI